MISQKKITKECANVLAGLPTVYADILPRVRYAVIGIDPGLGGVESDEGHCVLLVTESDIILLGGQVIKWNENLVRPFDHIRMFIDLARITDAVLAPCAPEVPIFVAVESNLAHMGSIYMQTFCFMYHRELTKHPIIFVGGMPPNNTTPAEEDEDEDGAPKPEKQPKGSRKPAGMGAIEFVLRISEQSLPQPVAPPVAPDDPMRLFKPRLGVWVNAPVKIENLKYYVAIVCSKTHGMRLALYTPLPVNATVPSWKGAAELLEECHKQFYTIIPNIDFTAGTFKNEDKKRSKDDLYMAMSNTLGWIVRYHRLGVAVQERYRHFIHRVNLRIMHTVLTHAATAGQPHSGQTAAGAGPGVYVESGFTQNIPQATLLHYTAVVSVAHRLVHQCRMFVYHTILFLWDGQPLPDSSRYAIERTTRQCPLPVSAYRALLERVFKKHDGRRREEFARHTSAWHVLRFVNTDRKPWFPLARHGKLEDGAQALLAHIKRFLVICLLVQRQYGPTHHAWQRGGSTNVVGLVLRHVYEHMLAIYGSLLPPDTGKLVPGTTAKAVHATPPPPPPGATAQVRLPGQLFHRYFQILGYERFLAQAYTQHRLALIANLLHNNVAQLAPEASPYGIGLNMRHQSRVRYGDVLLGVLQKHAELYDNVMRTLRKQHARHVTELYTITLLT